MTSPYPLYSPPVFAVGVASSTATTSSTLLFSVTSPLHLSPLRGSATASSKHTSPVNTNRAAAAAAAGRHISPSHSRTTGHDAAAIAAMERNIRMLEEQLVQEKLRGEWASRRVVAQESAKLMEGGNLFRLERRLGVSSPSRQYVPHNNNNNNRPTTLASRNASPTPTRPRPLRQQHLLQSYGGVIPAAQSPTRYGLAIIAPDFLSVPPSAKEMHDEISQRIERAEANNRRVLSAEVEVNALRLAAERSHQERLRALKKRRNDMVDRKMVAESQLRVAEASVADDDMLSDSQYRRYAARIEADSRETRKRYDSGAKQLEARYELRCSFIQKETDEMVVTMKQLVEEKRAELDRMAASEQSALQSARGLGAQLEEIDGADRLSAKLRNTLEVLDIKEREARSETQQMTNDIRNLRMVLSDLEGKLLVAAPDAEAKLTAQAAVLDGLHRTVRTLQERIVHHHREQRGDHSEFPSYPQVYLEQKLEDLETAKTAARTHIRKLRDEEARLSDFWQDLDAQLRQALLQGELLSAKLARERHEVAYGKSASAETVGIGTDNKGRGVTASGIAAILVSSPTSKRF